MMPVLTPSPAQLRGIIPRTCPRIRRSPATLPVIASPSIASRHLPPQSVCSAHQYVDFNHSSRTRMVADGKTTSTVLLLLLVCGVVSLAASPYLLCCLTRCLSLPAVLPQLLPKPVTHPIFFVASFAALHCFWTHSNSCFDPYSFHFRSGKLLFSRLPLCCLSNAITSS